MVQSVSRRNKVNTRWLCSKCTTINEPELTHCSNDNCCLSRKLFGVDLDTHPRGPKSTDFEATQRLGKTGSEAAATQDANGVGSGDLSQLVPSRQSTSERSTSQDGVLPHRCGTSGSSSSVLVDVELLAKYAERSLSERSASSDEPTVVSQSSVSTSSSCCGPSSSSGKGGVSVAVDDEFGVVDVSRMSTTAEEAADLVAEHAKELLEAEIVEAVELRAPEQLRGCEPLEALVVAVASAGGEMQGEGIDELEAAEAEELAAVQRAAAASAELAKAEAEAAELAKAAAEAEEAAKAAAEAADAAEVAEAEAVEARRILLLNESPSSPPHQPHPPPPTPPPAAALPDDAHGFDSEQQPAKRNKEASTEQASAEQAKAETSAEASGASDMPSLLDSPPGLVTPPGQCTRDARCVRGFRHGGAGGRCSFNLPVLLMRKRKREEEAESGSGGGSERGDDFSYERGSSGGRGGGAGSNNGGGSGVEADGEVGGGKSGEGGEEIAFESLRREQRERLEKTGCTIEKEEKLDGELAGKEHDVELGTSNSNAPRLGSGIAHDVQSCLNLACVSQATWSRNGAREAVGITLSSSGPPASCMAAERRRCARRRASLAAKSTI